jgi:hypothetical protein
MFKTPSTKPITALGLALAALLATSCSSGSSTSSASSNTMSSYSNWVNSLNTTGYSVTQGSIFLFSNSDCPLFVGIFGSCFGNNPAAPYIIPQLPIESSFVDPYYAQQLIESTPNGTPTDIIFRLSDHDAMITLVAYPPKGAYFGYQSYVFSTESSNYTSSDPLQVISPDPARYEIFGSIGNNINNTIIQNNYMTPWNGNMIMYITTSNQTLANDLISQATASGINPNSILSNQLEQM